MALPAELFDFLIRLKVNNDREWFQANKARYEEQVKAPLQAFIGGFDERLARLSAHFVADPRPVGGSLFRIYRDVRFSKDKSPYKTAAGIHFRHERGKDAHAPGYYLHLEPSECFAACGLWMPATAQAQQHPFPPRARQGRARPRLLPAPGAVRVLRGDPRGHRRRSGRLACGSPGSTRWRPCHWRQLPETAPARLRRRPPADRRPEAQGLLPKRQAGPEVRNVRGLCGTPRGAVGFRHTVHAVSHRAPSPAVLIIELGAEISEREGSRVGVRLFGDRRVFHRPHPRPMTDKGAVASIREWLKQNGVSP